MSKEFVSQRDAEHRVLRVSVLRLSIFLTIGVMMVMCLGFFGGCGDKNLPYNAVLYDRVSLWLNEDFTKENLTSGYDIWDEVSEKWVRDEALPKTRIFIINSKEEFDEIFKEFPTEINFETEMILLYGETTSSIRDFKIESIELEDGILKVKTVVVKPKGNPPGGNIAPYTRWTAVKLDKLETESVDFK